MFRITCGRGFHIEFSNGITLSTQFGGGNYCNNHDLPVIGDRFKDTECVNAEVAVFKTKGDKRGCQGWLTKEAWKDVFKEDLGDDVAGYVSVDQWLQVFLWCMKHKKVRKGR